MRVGFVHNPTNPDARAVLERGRTWCQAHASDAWDASSDDAGQIRSAGADSDLVCVLGGDGTFLRAARAIGDSRVPTLGVNLGRIGFLSKVEPAELEHALDQVAAGDYTVEERLRIAATLQRTDGTTETHACLNDVVVAYLEAVESGQSPDAQAWLARYPELATELAEFFADQAKVSGRRGAGRHADRLDRLFIQRRRVDPRPASAEHDHHPGRRLSLPAAQRGGR